MILRLVGAAWLAIFLLCSCSGGGESFSEAGEGSGTGDAIEIHLPGGDWGMPTPFTFYPRGMGYVHLSLIYDTLVWKDHQGTIPWLAKNWECSQDGLVWTFHLHPGVQWQDGKPLTARDVRFTFDYLKRYPVEWFSLEKVRDVEVPNDLTAVFYLESPYAPFLNQIAGSVPILPEHIWRDVSNPRETSAPDRVVGSGPYRLVQYDKAQGAYAYDANPAFFLGEPRVRKLFFVPVGDPVAALERGVVAEATVPASLLAKFREDKRFQLLSGPSYWVLNLQFNLNRFPFSEVQVRHALAHAVDRKALIEQSVPGGLEGAKPGNPGFMSPDSNWYDPSLKDLYSYDPVRSRELLEMAGIGDRNEDGVCEDSNGKPMQFTLLTTSSYLREAEALQLMLRKIGFTLDLKSLDIKTLDAMVREGRFDLALTGHGGLGGDPSIIYGFGGARDDPFSAGMPKDPEYLRTAELLSIRSDPAERMALCKTMQQLYARELPVLPLYYPVWFIAYRPDVFQGWFYTGEGGIGIGVPLPYNKLAFIKGRKP
ncbi:ABC transporter substrate-binding protein [Desulforhabdus amnigena]|uniref:Peptide ABC transporter substrate-binding protein n=1 Tax=Desulforhabdus amnigena TaxID=40218 RepID=A0A9W6FUY6_9BACT|nr:ABC transporter substrate-binding protein [Desulforhabdus amnigena]NLJ28496.1 ABC transporter substrate-binding protein [Deltaproteobacteria bacterium]GLI35381.1 peptide ABC transporter substrate-binding protein [Desulforhabdus amnigena]